MIKRRTKTNYINNRDFTNSIVLYQELMKHAVSNGTPPPKVPKYIGECILSMSSNLSKKVNFVGYTNNWKEEMVGDAIENAISALKSFNIEKTNNGFAYFTTVMFQAMVRRIKKEKSQSNIKNKWLENITIDDLKMFDTQDGDDCSYITGILHNIETSAIHNNSV
jgi:hypothetical protein